jgi:hypothetical protein
MVHRRSKHLTGIAADDLREATELAAARGTPINCAISINWVLFDGFGVPDDLRLARAQERLRHRLGRRDLESCGCGCANWQATRRRSKPRGTAT